MSDIDPDYAIPGFRAGKPVTIPSSDMSGFNVIHIMQGGPDVQIIDSRGRKWKFEDHPHFGPFVLGKNGDPLENQPPKSSTFWEAVNCWYQQGKATEQICGESFAKWVKPTMPKMIHIGGNHYRLDTSELQNQPPKAGG